MTKITYLLGAGASVHAIPTVDKFLSGLYDFRQIMAEEKNLDDQGNILRHELVTMVDRVLNANMDVNRYLTLKELVLRENSLDTYAKVLYLKDPFGGDLGNLKFVMTLYLAYLQVSTQPDRRYSGFLSSIIRDPNNQQLPDSVNILSWNYDLQMEMSYSKIFGLVNLKDAQRRLRVYSKHSRIINTMDSGFSVFKLNGSSTFHTRDGNDVILVRNGTNENLAQFVCRYYSLYLNGDLETSISFAWEQPNPLLEYAQKRTADTTVLVVIGYSFPFFNRDIDMALLRNMRHLTKVYIQDLNPALIRQTIMARIGEFDATKIIIPNGVEQFPLPEEIPW